jgi:hypothetical protein
MGVPSDSTEQLVRAAWLMIQRGDTYSALAAIDSIEADEWNREDVRTVANAALMLSPESTKWQD